jgi:NAD(P) transhydrogenase subunit beta
MNVLLAEANVAYDRLYDLEEINDQFEQADVVLVIGANDVVNPAAKSDPSSPIYGMPILNVDAAQSIVVLSAAWPPATAAWRTSCSTTTAAPCSSATRKHRFSS